MASDPIDDASDLEIALSAAKPGDVISFTNTIYLADIDFDPIELDEVSGTADQPITIQGVGDAQIEGDNSINECILIKKNNFILKDFVVKGCKKGIIGDNAENITLTNILVKNTELEGIKLRNFCKYWLIDHCTVQNTGGDSNEPAEGFYIGSAESTWDETSGGKPDECAYITLNDCIAEDTANDGFDIKEGSHDIKLVDCVARWTKDDKPVGNDIYNGNPVGNEGYFIRGNYVQIINSKAEYLTKAEQYGVRIDQEIINSITYGENISLFNFTAQDIQEYAISSTTSDTSKQVSLFPSCSLINTISCYDTTLSYNIQQDISFVENQWDGVGGTVYGTYPFGPTFPPTTTPTFTPTVIPTSVPTSIPSVVDSNSVKLTPAFIGIVCGVGALIVFGCLYLAYLSGCFKMDRSEDNKGPVTAHDQQDHKDVELISMDEYLEANKITNAEVPSPSYKEVSANEDDGPEYV